MRMNVMQLRCNDKVAIECTSGGLLHGSSRLDEVKTPTERAAILLIDRISTVVSYGANGRFSEIPPMCRSIKTIATEIGLDTMARIGLELAHLSRSDDYVAIRAVIARLERLAMKQLLGE